MMLTMSLNKTRGAASRVVFGKLARQTVVAAASSSAEKDKLSYSERQAALGRPVSPHVTIYKFPVVAISSITNRVTGVGLFAGVSAIGAITLLGGDSPMLMKAIGQSAVGPIAKGIVAFPLIYHYLGGAIYSYVLTCYSYSYS